LALNDFELIEDNSLFADAIRDLVVGVISEGDIANLLYSQYKMENPNN
jgi:death-on-curing protein